MDPLKSHAMHTIFLSPLEKPQRNQPPILVFSQFSTPEFISLKNNISSDNGECHLELGIPF